MKPSRSRRRVSCSEISCNPPRGLAGGAAGLLLRGDCTVEEAGAAASPAAPCWASLASGAAGSS